MKRLSYRLLAGISAAALIAALAAVPARSARRPKYGGTLRAEISARLLSAEPSSQLPAPDEANAARMIGGLLHDRGFAFTSGASAKLDMPGPFQLSEWEPGKHATLSANSGFSGGKPFVDSVTIQMGRSAHEALLDLELGKTDLAEIPVAEARAARERGVQVSVSQPDELIALVFAPGKLVANDAAARQAISLAVDRAAMVNFILQKNGEPAGGLLPQWASGTAFLFPTSFSVAAAKEHEAQKPGAPKIVLGYDAANAVEQAVAERIVVNSREAGIGLRAEPIAPSTKWDARLVRLRMSSGDSRTTLQDCESALRSTAGPDIAPAEALPVNATPQQVYDRERAIVSSYRVIPLLWVPRVYGLSVRVHDWTPPMPGEPWPLADVWLGEAR